MKKSKIAFLNLLFIFLLFASVQAAEEPVTHPSWRSEWEKAKTLEKGGSYLEAKEIYDSLLQKEHLGRKKRIILKEYEDLQMKMLFSKVETPGSALHTVVPGDTLYGIAKKYGTTIELLQKSNSISGDQIYPGTKLKVNQSKFSILIKKKSNRLTLSADGKPVKTYRVATGAGGSTPVGTFKIINRLKDPTWFHSGQAIPPDHPENILGSRWLGFDSPGYGIHGTTLPQTIGTQASKGCVRMHNSDVEELYTLIPVGTEVTIKD